MVGEFLLPAGLGPTLSPRLACSVRTFLRVAPRVRLPVLGCFERGMFPGAARDRFAPAVTRDEYKDLAGDRGRGAAWSTWARRLHLLPLLASVPQGTRITLSDRHPSRRLASPPHGRCIELLTPSFTSLRSLLEIQRESWLNRVLKISLAQPMTSLK